MTPKQDSSDQCSRNGTDSAKYCGYECFDTRHGSGVRSQGRVCGAEQNTCNGCQTQNRLQMLREIVPFTLTPISCAAPLSSETASIA